MQEQLHHDHIMSNSEMHVNTDKLEPSTTLY